jgi:hypothetical protein
MKLLFILLLLAVVAEMSGLAGPARPHHYTMLRDPWPPRARRALRPAEHPSGGASITELKREVVGIVSIPGMGPMVVHVDSP